MPRHTCTWVSWRVRDGSLILWPLVWPARAPPGENARGAARLASGSAGAGGNCRATAQDEGRHRRAGASVEWKRPWRTLTPPSAPGSRRTARGRPAPLPSRQPAGGATYHLFCHRFVCSFALSRSIYLWVSFSTFCFLALFTLHLLITRILASPVTRLVFWSFGLVSGLDYSS